MKKIKYVKLSEFAFEPTHGSSDAAGWDLYAAYSATIEPHKTTKVPTDLAFELPPGYFGAIFARSGLATREGLRPANCVGVCDLDYRGNYIVALHNDSDEVRYVQPGDRIAQLVIVPFLPVEYEEVEELSATERGAGGFGSTGK